MANWKHLIDCEARHCGETVDDIVSCTLTSEELLKEFPNDFGDGYGAPFTAWSQRRVYFPVTYDGAMSCGSAPRNPCSEITRPMGG